eukprot:258063-Rhodomonas_salina.1
MHAVCAVLLLLVGGSQCHPIAPHHGTVVASELFAAQHALVADCDEELHLVLQLIIIMMMMSFHCDDMSFVQHSNAQLLHCHLEPAVVRTGHGLAVCQRGCDAGAQGVRPRRQQL